MLNADAKDPTDPTEQAEPIDPTEQAEPTEPMDRTDPRDPIDRKESCDHKDHFDDGFIGLFSTRYLRLKRGGIPVIFPEDHHSRPSITLRCWSAGVTIPAWPAEPQAAA
jgi:hypothetical protein